MTRHAVWSDFRGVLTPPLAEGIRRFCHGREFTPDQLRECLRAIARRHHCPDGMAVLDSGVLDERRWTGEIERELAARYGVRADLSDFNAAWWDDRRVDHAWTAALRSWRRRGIFVGLVSNLPLDWKAGLAAFTAASGLDELFDDVVLSCDVGVRKPDAALFRVAESRSGLPPRFNILADDLAGNVAGADQAGWTGVLAGGDATQDAITRIESILRVRDAA
ncbi:MAG: HAD-IA family hydrolase [Actinomycetota bacterium]|nr:HAD-IA family hydrolase [Actinomycetota bacterium]